MDLTNVINHLMNLALPALALALVVPLMSRLVAWGRVARPSFWMQATVQFMVALAVVVAGLWLSGRDGKMVTYMTMVVAGATTQWVMLRGWRH